MNKDHCTAMPSSWVLTKLINKHCKQHDDDYVAQEKSKLRADYDFYLGMRQDIHPVLAGTIAVLASTGGVWFWYRRSLRRYLGGES